MLVSFDLETHLLKPGMVMPRMVCLSFKHQSTGESGLVLRESGLESARAWLEQGRTLLGQNVCFDLGVLCAEDESFIPLVFRAFDEGRILDTMIIQKMIDNANGDLKYLFDEEEGTYKAANFSLQNLVYRHFKKFIPKGADTWRLRYNELDGVPISEWPEAAVKYAIGDAVDTLGVYEKQKEIIDRDFDGEIPGFTSTMQAAWALHLMGAWGIRTDGDAVAKLKAELEIDYADAIKRAQAAGLVRGSGKRDMKAIRSAVQEHYLAHSLEIPLTEKGQISTDRDCLNMGRYPSVPKHPGLVAVSDVVRIQKLLKTYVSALEKGTEIPCTPAYNVMVESFRTSCSGGGKSSSGWNCFDGETEILTSSGWIRFDQLKGSDVCVAQWDAGVITFVDADRWEYVETEADAFVHLTNQHIDLFVTPDHRCLLRSTKNRSILKVIPASEYSNSYDQLHAGLYAGGGLQLSAAQMAVLCATQADGCWHDDGVSFRFKKSRKIERLCSALDELGAKYTRYPSGGMINVYLRKQSAGWLHELLGEQKAFGPWVLSFSRETLDLFCAEVYFWDGCWTRKNHYSSNIKANTDWVQIAHLLSGSRANVRIYQPREGLLSGWGKEIKGPRKPNFQVDVTHREYSLTANISRSEHKGGKAYCVSVPSSFILVRRNGKAVVTGNCQNPPQKNGVRECVVPRPGRVFVFADYSTLELCTLAQTCLDLPEVGFSRMAEVLNEGKDLHLDMAIAILGGGMSYDEAVVRLKSGDPILKEARSFAKVVDFGCPGGLGAATLVEFARASKVSIDERQAKDLIALYKRNWPEMEKYFTHISNLCSADEAPYVMHPRTGMIRGRVRYTAASNHYFQHLAGVGAKDAVYHVVKECYLRALRSPLYGCRPVLFLHDEIGMEVPYDDPTKASRAAARLSEIMVTRMKVWCPAVPIKAEPVMSRRWYKGCEAAYLDGLLVPSRPEKYMDEGKEKIRWVADVEGLAGWERRAA